MRLYGNTFNQGAEVFALKRDISPTSFNCIHEVEMLRNWSTHSWCTVLRSNEIYKLCFALGIVLRTIATYQKKKNYSCISWIGAIPNWTLNCIGINDR